jgi:type I restriction enzyme R subunit
MTDAELKQLKDKLLVVDWYKDDKPREMVKDAIRDSLNEDLPPCYDKPSFQAKITLLLNHFIDMAVQGYGWIANAIA